MKLTETKTLLDLPKPTLDGLLAKAGKEVVVRRLPVCDGNEVQTLLADFGDIPRRADALAVCKQKHRRHHRGTVWWLAGALPVGLVD